MALNNYITQLMIRFMRNETLFRFKDVCPQFHYQFQVYSRESWIDLSFVRRVTVMAYQFVNGMHIRGFISLDQVPKFVRSLHAGVFGDDAITIRFMVMVPNKPISDSTSVEIESNSFSRYGARTMLDLVLQIMRLYQTSITS